MDIEKIIRELPSMTFENLQELSEAIREEIDPSFEKLEDWKVQSQDRNYEWVVHSYDGIFYTALVLFYDGQIDLHKGRSTEESTSRQMALRSAIHKISNLQEVEPTSFGKKPDSEADLPNPKKSGCQIKLLDLKEEKLDPPKNEPKAESESDSEDLKHERCRIRDTFLFQIPKSQDVRLNCWI